MAPPVRVLFIAGTGRSGGTIFHNVLGQVGGFAAVGELREAWQRGMLANWPCGCGRPFRECELWNEVLQEAFGGIERTDAAALLRETGRFRLHHLPLTALPVLRERKLGGLREYLGQLARFYRAIDRVTDGGIIIDASRNPSYGYLLRMLPDVELTVVHLIRDPRAVAHSWSKRKLFLPDTDSESPRYMPRYSMVKSALQWNARNLATETHLNTGPGRFLRLRYEDFVRQPQRELTRVLELFDASDCSLPFVGERTVELRRPNHSVFGNLVRFQTGPIQLRLDDEWRRAMRPRDKAVVTALTSPLLMRYGYRL